MVDTTKIQRIIRDYYKKLYTNKTDNLEEKVKFLERHNFQGWTRKKQKIWIDSSKLLKLKLWFKNFQQKSRIRWLHRWILSNTQRGVNTYSSQTLPKNCRGKSTPKLTLWGPHHPDTRQRCHKKRKLQANTTDEQRCKIPQQNTNRLNPATYIKIICFNWIISVKRCISGM